MRRAEPGEGTRFAKAKARRIADLQASIAFFSAGNKAARERWVIRELLRNLGTRHSLSELVSVPPRDEPPDVVVRSGRFEIKEELDNNRQRHREFKQALERAKAATTMQGLFRRSGYSPITVGLPDLVFCAQRQGGLGLHKYGARLAASLDLAIYYNRLDVMELRPGSLAGSMPSEITAWRSVSMLFGRRAIVFYAARGAPRFIALAQGKVKLRS